MKIIMLGAPGAGKGTQAKKIAAKYEIPHISTGDIFRANIKNGTELGKKAKTYMDQGLLVPDELVVDLVVDRVNQEDCANGYVLDGFPRTIPQAEALDKALEELGQKMDYAIDVDVPDENIINRMSGRRACVDCGATYHIVYASTKQEGICDNCGGSLILRDDDKPETVQKRLVVYHEQTQPLIDYYMAKGILKTVDGTVDLEDVFKAIVDILKQFGADIEIRENEIISRKADLKGIKVDVSDIPDTVPALAVAAAFANGRTEIVGGERLRYKESDRIESVVSNLKRLGADVEETADGMIINGGKPLCGAELCGYNDHRIVMAFSIAALFADDETAITEAESIEKTYPSFFEDYNRIGGQANVFGIRE